MSIEAGFIPVIFQKKNEMKRSSNECRAYQTFSPDAWHRENMKSIKQYPAGHTFYKKRQKHS
jgi:hypothetical protein